jgi:hypothetical protein
MPTWSVVRSSWPVSVARGPCPWSVLVARSSCEPSELRTTGHGPGTNEASLGSQRLRRCARLPIIRGIRASPIIMRLSNSQGPTRVGAGATVKPPVKAAGPVDAKSVRPPVLGKRQNLFSTGFHRTRSSLFAEGDLSNELRTGTFLTSLDNGAGRMLTPGPRGGTVPTNLECEHMFVYRTCGRPSQGNRPRVHGHGPDRSGSSAAS